MTMILLSQLVQTTLHITEFTLPGTTITCIKATDKDSYQNGKVQFRANGGDGDGVFVVNQDGKVSLGAQHIYYDSKQSYNLIVEAYDLGFPKRASQTTLTIKIHKAYTQVKTKDTAVPENLAVGSTVSNVSSVDPYTGSDKGFRYYLIGKSSVFFAMNEATGEITLRQPLDRETQDKHILSIQSRGPTSNGIGELTVDVTDINDNSPIFNPTNYLITVSETELLGQPIVTITANDKDLGINAAVEYSIASGQTDLFEIDSISGEIKLKDHLDYEKSQSHSLTISAKDKGSIPHPAAKNANVQIIVRDYNDNCPKFENSTYEKSVREQSFISAPFLQLVVTDKDLTNINNRITCTVDEPLAKQYFKITTDCKLSLKTGVQLDYEKYTQFRFVVKATNSGSVQCQMTANIIINVLDIPDVRPHFDPQYYNITIPESTLIGTMVVALKAVSPVKSLTYTLFPVNSNNDLSKFNINKQTGEMMLSGIVDREKQDKYVFTVQVNDGSNNALIPARIEITILDVNDNAPIFNTPICYQRTLSENSQKGSYVTDAIASDADIGKNGEFTYSLLNSAVCNSLTINPTTGRVVTTSLFNYENRNMQYCLIKATDNGKYSLSGYACLTVTISNINDMRPVFAISTYNVTIQESALVNTLIASLHANDADSTVIFYRIASGNNLNHFKIGNDGKLTIQNSLDYESIKSYALEIEARDDGTPTLTSLKNAMVYITVTDVNDNRPQFDQSYYAVTIPENLSVGTTIINVTAMDNDHGVLTKQLFYSALENTTAFKVNPDTGAITITRKLDYERSDSYNLVVVVQDRGSPYLSNRAMIDITVTDINDNRPAFTETVYNIKISEKALVGTSVVSLLASDADASDNNKLLFQIETVLTGSTGFFKIVKSTIELAKELDYEAPSQRFFVLLVSVKDPRGLAAINKVTVSISVRDINDREPVFTLSKYIVQVDESKKTDTLITIISASDGDSTPANNNIVYSLPEATGDATNFRVVTSGVNCIIFSKNPLDYEFKKVWTFSVKASDQVNKNTLTGYTTVTVLVNDLNDNPPIPVSYNLTVNISEATTVLSTIAVIHANDADTGINAKLRYKILHPETPPTFTIDNHGVLRLARKLDSFIKNMYKLIVQVSDSGVLTPLHSNVSVVVNVEKVILAGIKFEYNHYKFSVNEGSIKGTVGSIGTILAVDTGIYQSKQFSYEIASDKLDIVNMFTLTGRHIIQLKGADYEKKNAYSFMVKANNERGASAYAHVTIAINDINEKPYFVGLSATGNYHFQLSESISLPSYIYAVVAKDDDNGLNGELEYQLINPPFGNFSIDKYGRIQAWKHPGRQVSSTYEFQVLAQDKGTPPLTTNMVSVLMTVLDYNDNRPIFYPSGPFQKSVLEGENGTNIGILFANDSDAGQNKIIRYTGIYPEGKLKINRDNGIISIIKPFDFEQGSYYEFIAVAQDTGTPYMSSYKVIQITVINRNDEHPDFPVKMFNMSVSEKATVGSVVMAIRAEDKDHGVAGQVTGYDMTFSGGADNTFVINANGIITLNKPVNYQARKHYSYTIKAHDGGSPRLSSLQDAIINIFITDYSEMQPYFALQPYVTYVYENISSITEIVTVSANSSEPKKGPFTYSLVPSTDSASFTIHQKTGIIRNKVKLNFEDKQNYAFEVQVKDEYNSRTGKTMVIVYVLDINDNSPNIKSLKFTYNISDSTWPGTFVAKVDATDLDSGENGRIIFSAVSGDGSGVFGINSNGYITLNGALDSRIKNHYTLQIKAEDQGAPSNSVFSTLTFYIHKGHGSANVPSFDIYHYKICIDENKQSNNLLQVNATNSNPVPGSKIIYSLGGDKNELAPFTIDITSGIIALSQQLNFEIKKEYNFLVYAVNNEGRRDVAVVTICVNNIDDNSPVFNPSSININVNEREDVGYLVYQMTVSDPDEKDFGNAKTYSIMQGNSLGKFHIDNTGRITLSGKLDLESSQSSFTLVVRLTEGKWSIFANVVVQVTDWNDKPPKFTKTVNNTYTFTISESQAVGTNFANLTALDTDITSPNNKISYSLLTTETDFEIKPIGVGHSALYVSHSLDYARKNRYEMVAIATDHGYLNLTGTVLVIINIVDTNNHGPVFSPLVYNNTVSEAATVGTTILRVMATDKDTGAGGKVFFSIQDPTSTFIVDNNGDVVLNKALNYENRQGYTLAVTAKDGGNVQSTNTASVYITVTEVNDNQPTFELLYYKKDCPEDYNVSTSLLTVKATDRDRIGNTILYSIITNGDSVSFNVNPTTGVIQLAKALDYETQKRYTFTVKAEDSGNKQLFGNAHVTIDITDVNDNNPQFVSGLKSHNITVIENIHIGSLLTVVTATDQDSGHNGFVSYSIVAGNEAGKFVIDGNGQIRLIKTLRGLQQRIYTLTVNAKDAGSPERSTNAIVTINVRKYYESVPVFNSSIVNLFVPENTPVNSKLLTLAFTKTMPGSNMTISFHRIPKFPEFALKGNDMILVKSLDFETKKLYNIIIIATDAELDATFAHIILHVQNLNEHAPQFDRSIYEKSVSELAYIGHSVLSLIATDHDGSKMFYKITTAVPDNAFVLKDNVVLVNGKLKRQRYEFTVSVDDGTFHSSTAKVIITVRKENIPAFGKSTYIVNVREDLVVGEVFLNVSACSGCNYTIESVELNKLFHINSFGK